MATTITPSTGQNVGLLQLGPGATGYGAIDWRRQIAAMDTQEGVFSSGAWKVTAGGALNVSVAASTGDGALVQGDNIASQGLYYVAPHSSAIVEAMTTAHATLPRIDQVILEVLDATHDGGASNTARTRVVDGTATSGATLDNRNGAVPLPNNAIRLADVLIAAAGATVLAGNIRDRRPWAKGAEFEVVHSAGTLLATTSTTFAELNSALSKRVELSGVNLQWAFGCNLVNSFANVGGDCGPWVDGAAFSVAGGGGKRIYNPVAAAAQGSVAAFHVLRGITSGSHLISVGGASGSGSGTATFSGDATRPAQMAVRELVSASANNS